MLFIWNASTRRRARSSRERDALVRRWDHLIRIRPLANDCCRYLDEIDIDAGPLTLLVWLFAQVFYRHRQRRWQRVAERLQFGAGSVAQAS
jgi:hypothetical protein